MNTGLNPRLEVDCVLNLPSFSPLDVGTLKDVIESNEDEMKVLQDQLEQKTNQTVALEEEHTALQQRFQEKCKELELLNNNNTEASYGNNEQLQENVDRLCQEMQTLKQQYEKETGLLQEQLNQKEQELAQSIANQQQQLEQLTVEDSNKLRGDLEQELKVVQQKHQEEMDAVKEELKMRCQELEEHKLQREKNQVCKVYNITREHIFVL